MTWATPALIGTSIHMTSVKSATYRMSRFIGGQKAAAGETHLRSTSFKYHNTLNLWLFVEPKFHRSQQTSVFSFPTWRKRSRPGRGNSPCSDVSATHNPALRASRAREERRSHMVPLKNEKSPVSCSSSPHLDHQLANKQKQTNTEKGQSQKESKLSSIYVSAWLTHTHTLCVTPK